MNNKLEYGITLKDAKIISVQKIGRLPKCGREIIVKEGKTNLDIIMKYF
jgi:hypothetical protein